MISYEILKHWNPNLKPVRDKCNRDYISNYCPNCKLNKFNNKMFRYNSKRKIFKCFGCGIVGNHIKHYIESRTKTISYIDYWVKYPTIIESEKYKLYDDLPF